MPEQYQGDGGMYVTHNEFSSFREDVRGQFVSIHSEFTSLKGSLDRMATSIEKRNTRFDEKLNEASEKASPKAPDLKGVASVAFGAFGVVVLFLAIYIRPVEDATNSHINEPGHAEAMQLHAAYGERFQTLATDIAANRSSVGGVENRFATWNYRLADRAEALSREITELRVKLATLEALAGEWPDARQERHDLESRVRALEIGK